MAQRRSEIAEEHEAEGVPGLDDSDATAEGSFAPRDHPVAASEHGVTAREQRTDEPIAERATREQPEDPLDGEPDEDVGRLVAPDQGDLFADVEKDEVALDSGDGTALSAEEAAMHVTDEP